MGSCVQKPYILPDLADFNQEANSQQSRKDPQVIQQNQFKFREQICVDGKDQRKPISQQQMRVAPLTNLGLVQFAQNGLPDVRANATAYLISDQLVLTAAHSFFKRRSETRDFQRLEPITFIHGLHSKLQSRKYEIKAYYICKAYQDIQNKFTKEKFDQFNSKEIAMQHVKYDFAVIVLKKKVSQFINPKIITDFRIPAGPHPVKAAVYGYKQQKIPVYHQNTLVSIENGIMQHRIHTSEGQSGSPIILRQDNSDYLIGIHSGGSVPSNINFGVLLTKKMFEVIIDFRRQKGLKGSEFDFYQQHEGQIVAQVKPAIVRKENMLIFDNPFNPAEFKKFDFSFNMNTQQAQLYSISANTIKRSVDKYIPYQNYAFQLASATPFPGGKHSIKFAIESYAASSSIVVGLITHNRYGKPHSGYEDQKQCISLWLEPLKRSDSSKGIGQLFIEGVDQELGKLKDSQIFVPKGKDMSLLVDLVNGFVHWVYNEGPRLTVAMPSSFSGKDIFFFIGMIQKGECIRIL